MQSCCNTANCYAVLIYTSSGTCYLKRTFPSSAVSSSSTYSIYYLVRDSVANYLDVQKYGNGDCSGSVTTYSSYGIDTCVSYQDLAYTEHAYHLYQLETQTSSADFTVRHLIWFEAPGCTSPESEWTRADVNETQGSSSCYDQYRNIEVSSNPRDIPESAVTTEDTYQPQYVIWRKYAEVCDEGPPQRASYSIGQCHEEETQRDSFKFETTGTHPAEGYQMEVSWWDGSTSCSGSPSSRFNITWGCRTTNPGSGYFTFSSSSVSSTCSATTTTGVSRYVSSYRLATYLYTTWDACLTSCCSRSNCYAFMRTSTTCYLLSQFPSSAPSSNSMYTLYYMVRDGKSKPGAFLDTRVYNSDGCGGSVTDYITYPIESCVPYKYLEYHNNAYQMFQVDSYTSTRNFVVRHLVWFEAPGCTAPESDWDTPDINETRSSDSCYKNYTFYELKHAPRDPPVSAVSTQDTYQPQYVIWRKYAGTCNVGPPQRASYSIDQCHEEETQRDSFKFETTGTHPAEGYQMEVSWWDGSTSCSGSPSSRFNITWGCRSTNPGSGYFTFSSSSVSSTCSATTTTGVSRYVSSYRLATYSYTTWDACLTSCCSRSNCYAFMRTSTTCYLLSQFPSSAPTSSSTYTLYYMVRDGKSKPGAFLDTRVYNSDGCGGSVTDYITYPIESCVPYKYLEYHNNAYQMFQVDSYTSTRNFVVRHLVWFEAPGCTAPESDWDTPDINETRSSDSCYKNYTFYELKHAPRDPPVSAVSTQDTYQPQYVIWRKYAGSCSAGPPQRASYSIDQCHEEETQRDSFKFETTGTHPAEGYQMEVSWWDGSTSCSGSPSSRFNITWGCRSTNPGSGYFTFSSSSVSSTCSATTTTGVSRYVSSYRLATYSYTTWDACLTSCCSRSNCYAFMRTSTTCYLLSQFPSSAPTSSSTYTLYYMVRDGKSKPGAFLDTRVYNSDGCGGSVTDYISYPIESCVPYKYLEYHNNAYQMFQVDSYTSTRNFVLRHLVWFEAPGCTAPESDWDTPDINETRSSDSCYKNYTFYELKHAPRDPPVSAVSTQDTYQPQYVIWRKYAGTCNVGPPQRASYSIDQCHEEETQRDSFKFETTGTHPAEGYQMEVSWWDGSTSCSGSPSSRFNITWGCRSTNPGSGYFTFSSSSVSSTCSATTTTGVSRYVSSYRLATYSYTTWDACLTSCCSRSNCYAFMRTSTTCYLLSQFPSSAPSSSSSYTLYYMVRDGKSKPGAFLDTRVYNSDGCGGSVTDYISYPIESCVPYKYLEYHNNAYQMFQVDSYTSTRNFVLRHLVWFEAPGCTAPESDWDTPDINETRSSDSCYKNYTFYELKHAPRDPPVSAVSTQDTYQPQYVIWRKYAGSCSAGPPQKASYSIDQCHEEETQRDSFKFETTGTHPAEGYQMEVSWWDGSTSCSGSPSSRFNITWGCRSTNPGSGYFTFSSSSVSSTCSATTTTGVSRYVSSYRLATYSYTTWDACLTSCCSRSNCYAFMRTSTTCYLLSQFPSSAPSSSSTYTLYYMVRDGKSKPGAFLDTRVYNSDGCGGSVTDYISYPIESCVPYKYLEYHNNAYQMFQVDSYTSTRNFVVRHLVWFEAPGCTAPESDWDTPDINTTRSSDSCYKNYTFYELKHAPRDPPITAVSTQDNYQPQYVIWRKYAGTCSAGPPQRASYSIGQCHEEETLRDSFKFETTGTHPTEGYQMEVSWWDGSTSCSGSPSSRFNITWGCRTTYPGRGYYTFSTTGVSSSCSATSTAGVFQYVSTSTYATRTYSYTTWDECFSACCSRSDCHAFMISSSRCYVLVYFSPSVPTTSTSYTLYYIVRDGKSKPGAFLDTRVYNSDGCGGSVADYISYPIESCVPYKYLAYHSHAYQMFQVDSYTSTRNFVIRHLVWFEAPGCTAPESDWDTPDINETRSSESCYKNYTFYEVKYAARDRPVTAVSTQDNFEPQHVIWRKYADTCNAGPPRKATYSLSQCYEEEALQDSFKFETTGTHPTEGYQMEVSWWDGSTSCSGSPSSRFNITWGCRSPNPGSGYFTFESPGVSTTCSGTTTTGMSQYVSPSTYATRTITFTTWDDCFSSCCGRSDCHAFMISSSRCYVLVYFSPSVPTYSSSNTIYYMVRDGSTTPRGYVDTRVHSGSSCTGSITDYTSFPLGHCTRYTYLEYTDHTYQMVYLDSYTNQNTYSLRHLVWHTAPGCTVDSSQWNTPDINVTRNYGDCFQDYSFWTAKYAPYTRDVDSIVTGADSFVPTYVDHKKYSTPCTSSVTEQLSYQLGYCYQGYGGSFTIRRTTNHATYGYQMKVEIWSGSTSCSGDPSEVFTIVWGCRVAASFSGDFVFSSSPSYTVPEGFELSSSVAMSSSTTSSSSSTSTPVLSSSSSIYSSSSSSPFSSSTLPTTTMVSSTSSAVLASSSVMPSSSSVVPSSSSMVPSSSSMVPSSSSMVPSSSSMVASSSSVVPSSSPVVPASSSMVPSSSSMVPSSSSVVPASSSMVPASSFMVLSSSSLLVSSSSMVPSSSSLVLSSSSMIPSSSSVVPSSSSAMTSSSSVVTSSSSVVPLSSSFVPSSSVIPSTSSAVPSATSVVPSSSSVVPSSFSSAVPSSSQPMSSVIQSASMSSSLSTSSVSPASSSSSVSYTSSTSVQLPTTSSMQSSTTSCGLLPSPTPLSHPVCPEATTTRGLSVVVVQSKVYLLRHLSGVTKEQCFIACCSNDDCYSFTQSLTSNECWLYRQHPQTAVQVSEHHTTFYMVRNSPGPYLDAWLYSGEGCTSLSGYTSYSLGTCVPYMGLSYAEHSYQLFQLECFSSSEFTVRHLVWYEAPGCTVPRNEWSTPNVNESVESSECYGNVRFFSVKDQPRDIPIEAVTEVDNFVPTYVNYVKYSSCDSNSAISRVSYKTGKCYAENRDSFMFEQTSGHPTSGYQMKVKWWSGIPTCSGSPSQQFYIIWGCQVTSMFTGMFSFTDSAQFVLPGQSVTATPTNEPTDAPPKVAEQTSTIIGASVAVCVVIVAVVIVAVVVVVAVVLFKVKKKQTIELSNDYGNISEHKWDVFDDAEERDVMTIRNPLSVHDIDFDKMDED